MPEICLELTKLVVGALTTAGEVREDRERNELKRYGILRVDTVSVYCGIDSRKD